MRRTVSILQRGRISSVAFLFLAACQGGVPAASEAGPDTVVAADLESPRRIGRFIAHVDPLASSPEDVFRTEPLVVEGSPVGARREALVSVLTEVSLFGPGVWDAATETLNADVRMTNTGAAPLDEPRLVIVTITNPDVVFLNTHIGLGREGSAYAFADIEANPGAANNASARQLLSISSPGGVAFSFTYDVLAEEVLGTISPDADDDRFNDELGEPAGDDCDDTDANVYPGAGGCQCLTDCNSCGGGGCCEQACGATGCDCGDGCDCDVTNPPGEGTTVDCTDASCTVTCRNSADGDCSVGTCDGSTCVSDCRNSGGDCDIDSCTAGSSCDIDCRRVDGGCQVDTCDGSTCNVDCQNAGDDCEVTSCTDSTCTMDCRRGEDCTIGACIDSSCSMYCRGNGVDCTMNCGTGSQCLMNCRARGGGSCNLSCDGGAAPVDCSSNIEVCPGTPCP